MGEPEHRIEWRLTGEAIPASAVYMTTRDEPDSALPEDAPAVTRHYFRVPVVGPSPMLGFGQPEERDA